MRNAGSWTARIAAWAIVVATLGALAFAQTNPTDPFIPFDTRWEYNHLLNYRPGDGQTVRLNPPRMSWPYTPNILPTSNLPASTFRLQLSQSGDFAKPDYQSPDSPYNFYNALPVLKTGKWHWRVGYDVGTDREQWSAVRSFTIPKDAQKWDRTVIEKATKIIASHKRPRFGPPDGDWRKWRGELEKSTEGKAYLDSLLRTADSATKKPYWTDFPKTDAKGKTKYDGKAQFKSIGYHLTCAAMAHKLTGDAKYADAKKHFLQLAQFEIGGRSSPEYHGGARKWCTQLIEHLALFYDWYVDDLTPAERKQVLHAIDWRLKAIYFTKYSWKLADGRTNRSGVAVHAVSHPYENFMWATPAVMLACGDSELATELTPLILNYLTGVTAGHGPDGGWNEGLSYGVWKSNSMLIASMFAAVSLPELHLGDNPFYDDLGDWMAWMLPMGIQHTSYGDYASKPQGRYGNQRNQFRHLAWLTGQPRFAYRYEAMVEATNRAPSQRPWVDLVGLAHFQFPKPEPPERHAILFSEPGWVMVDTGNISNPATYAKSLGMIFKCRPRGGYSHSFRAEGDYTWFAYGQTLSSVTGSTVYADTHCRASISHNVIFVNGQGQEWGPAKKNLTALGPAEFFSPRNTFHGRLLAYKETDDYVYWVGDATHAYQQIPELERWQRHVVFVDGKWFAIYDDLAMRPGADPATFSWLYQLRNHVPLKISGDRVTLDYKIENVNARISMANKAAEVKVDDRQDRDAFVNPITGLDYYESTAKHVTKHGRKYDESIYPGHCVWVSNKQPTDHYRFFTVLTAWPDGSEAPEVKFQDENVAYVKPADGAAHTVAFGPATGVDFLFPLQSVEEYGERTDPNQFPAEGRSDTLALGSATFGVTWLSTETFDGPAPLSKWVPESDSLVEVAGGALKIAPNPGKSSDHATIWMRPYPPKNAVVRFHMKATAVQGAPEPPRVGVFLHATGWNGKPYTFNGDGSLASYGSMAGYAILFAPAGEGGGRLVRLGGKAGFARGMDASVDPAVLKEFTVASYDGRIVVAANGKTVLDMQDEEAVEQEGRIGLWLQNVACEVQAVEVGRINGVKKP